jgi:hypothetical protein
MEICHRHFGWLDDDSRSRCPICFSVPGLNCGARSSHAAWRKALSMSIVSMVRLAELLLHHFGDEYALHTMI